MRNAALLLLAFLVGPAWAEESLPAASYPGAPDGRAAPFAGTWSIIRPGGDRLSITDSCAMPAEIVADGAAAMRYHSTTGADFDFELSAQNGGTALDGELARLAVWANEDSFYLYQRLADGSPDLASAYIYERCPSWPRKSHDGAVAGALAPFVGNWQEAMPALRGFTPLQVVGSCDDPTTFSIKDDKTLLRTIANEPDRAIPIGKRGQETISPNPMAPRSPSVIVWVSPDRFHFHGIDIAGRTDWNTPVIYTRCPG
jgi:hypothetical protein